MQELTPNQVEELLGDGSAVELPNAHRVIRADLSTPGIADELAQAKLGNVLLKKDDSLEVPCYLIDFRKGRLSLQALKTLKGLLANSDNGKCDGDVALYIWGKDVSGATYLNKIGYGSEYDFYIVLETLIPAVYGDDAQVYKNLGKGLVKAGSMDVSSVILDI